MPSPCVPGSGWRTIRASSRLPARSWNGSGRTVAGTATRARQDDARHSTSHSRPPGGYTSTRWQRAPVGQAFAAARAAELFLEHRLFRSLQSGEVIDDAWLVPHYPPYWHYDVLQALLVLARLGKARDPRAQEGLELLIDLRRDDGRWHPGGYWWRPPGGSGSNVEVVDWGRRGPNELITLNALRVLRAAGRLAPTRYAMSAATGTTRGRGGSSS